MKYILAILLMISSNAYSVDFDVSIGQAMWTRSDNGTWWQTPFKATWPNNTVSYSLGISNKIKPWLRWNIGYTNLGIISSYGQAVGDDVYISTNGCTTGSCPEPDEWYGKGSVDGVYFTLAPQFTFHNITYSTELGVWNYQPLSTVYVPIQHPCGLCVPSPSQNNIYFITSSNRMWGQVIGFKVEYKDVYLRTRAYYVESSDRDYPATYQKYTYEVSLGYTF